MSLYMVLATVAVALWSALVLMGVWSFATTVYPGTARGQRLLHLHGACCLLSVACPFVALVPITHALSE